ncbi:MAG TPA: class I SAM-dependent methyltransferase [Gaiellaceae bacterium]|nr:class I SAM-dependent methyltransferase [Gaiellaceae bacterium]
MAAAADSERRDALVERLFEAVLGFNDLFAVYIGDRLGLYAALADGAATPGEVASSVGCDERYVREWLEHQAVGGILEVDDPAAGPAERRYRIPPGHDEVLLDRDSVNYMAAFARMMVGMVHPLPQVLAAFRSGRGVPYADYPDDFLEGQGDMNRTQYVNLLASEWLPALPDVDERLRAGSVRVADVACGTGWSSIAIAKAYPDVHVDGFDLDPQSIMLARSAAAAESVGERVDFQVRDAADPALAHRYDLVTVFEAIHDLAKPVEALAAIRDLLADGGVALVADEKVADEFTAPGDDVERVMYGWSILHCLPVGRVEQPSAETGTAMRQSTFRRYAEEAGFSSVQVVPIEHDFWRFYRLTA